MATTEVGNIVNAAIKGREITGVVSGSPKAFYGIPSGASYYIKPTAAGTAVVKISVSPVDLCKTDVANNNFTTGVAEWFDWTPGAVTALDSSYASGEHVAIACVVTSGTWKFGVSR